MDIINEKNPVEAKPAEPTELEKIELDNVRIEAALKKRDELLSRQTMAGKADAGAPQPRPAVETPKEYAKRIMSGKLTEAEKARK